MGVHQPQMHHQSQRVRQEMLKLCPEGFDKMGRFRHIRHFPTQADVAKLSMDTGCAYVEFVELELEPAF